MREAIRLSLEGPRAGRGGPFGCVVVRAGKVIGSGSNQVTSTCDPTAHAEIVAIREACRTVRSFSLADCEIYASCEPCPMCLSAIYWARIPEAYYANSRQDAAAIGFDDDFIYQQIPLPVAERRMSMTPLLCDEAKAAFAEWKGNAGKVAY